MFPIVVHKIPTSQGSRKPVAYVTDLWQSLQIYGMREKFPTRYVC